MIAVIARKELLTFLRSGVFLAIAVSMFVLFSAAAIHSAERASTFERERIAAESVDREVWDSQGERNPHSAAHFARYAFKPIPGFAAFDPGVTDYAGMAYGWRRTFRTRPCLDELKIWGMQDASQICRLPGFYRLSRRYSFSSFCSVRLRANGKAER